MSKEETRTNGPATMERRAGEMVTGAARKKRVLVVDDQPRVMRFVEIFLKLKGFDVISAASGHEALELVASREPDIMLLDIVMPGMDGFEVMKRLRTFSMIPVIAISATIYSHGDTCVAGADDFLPKPFQTEDMLKKINRLLRL